MLAGVNVSTVKMKSPLLKKSNISFTKPAGNPAFSICLIPLGFFSVLRHCHWSLYIVSHHLREAERKSEHEEVYAFTPASAKHWKAAQLFRCTQAEELIFTFFLSCALTPWKPPASYRHGHGHTPSRQKAETSEISVNQQVLRSTKSQRCGPDSSALAGRVPTNSLARAAADSSQQ